LYENSRTATLGQIKQASTLNRNPSIHGKMLAMTPGIQPALPLSTALLPDNRADLSVNNGSGLNVNNLSSSLPTSSASQGLGRVFTTVANGSGLLGQYYDNLDLTNLKLTRTDPAINFIWPSGESPAAEIAPTTFSVRWTGAVEAQYSESYTFYTVSDDGVRLWVNGQELVNNWTDHGSTENSGTISLVAGQRYDIKIEYYQGGGGATAQLLWSSPSQTKSVIPQARLYGPDLTLPTANLPPSVSDAVTGSATYGFTVVYNDLTGVSRATIDNQDVLVTGPNNFSQLATLVSVSNDSNASSLTATYRINAPGGGWNANTVGLYTIVLQGNQVSDIDGNSIPTATLGTFRASVTPPTVNLDPLRLATEGATSYDFRVYYESPTPLNRATIDSQDIVVTGPNNFSQVAQLGSVNTNTNGSLVIANYRFNAPGGSWDAADAGTYTLTLQANQVSDVSNNFIPTTTLGALAVDFALPTAVLSPLTPVTIGSASYQFSVTYSDDVAVRSATINDQDILVSGPNNFSQLAKLVSVSGNGNGSSLTAVYSIDAPGGVWDVADQGSYTLTLQSNQISDTGNNFSPTSVLGTLKIDLIPPIAKLTTANLASVGDAAYDFTVLYRDDALVRRSTIATQNVRVTGPNNFNQIANLVSVSSPGDAGFLIATYRIAAPGGAWNVAAMGTYTITLQANQVSDTEGNFIPAAVLGTFAVAQTAFKGDFDGDGKLDLLLLNATGTKLEIWLMDGTTVKSKAVLVGFNPSYAVAGVADFDGDGKADILLRDAPNQKLAAWFMNGTSVKAGAFLPDLNARYTIANFGDFDGDQKTDLLLRDTTNQQLAVWLLNGASLKAGAFLPKLPASYTVAGLGNFDGDRTMDILLRDEVNGKIAVWLMNGITLKAGAFLPDLAANYTIANLGDFDGDGKTDVLLRDTANQRLALWLINDTQLKAGAFLPTLDSGYTIAGVQDFDGDGKADILVRDVANRKVMVWLLNGMTVKASAFLPDLDATVSIAALGDFSGDRKADIVLRDDADITVWLVNGTTVASSRTFPTNDLG
jgi:PA14 domain/FG-GAP-like repeat